MLTEPVSTAHLRDIHSTAVHGATFLGVPGLKPQSAIVWAGQNVPEVFRAKGKILLMSFSGKCVKC